MLKLLKQQFIYKLAKAKMSTTCAGGPGCTDTRPQHYARYKHPWRNGAGYHQASGGHGGMTHMGAAAAAQQSPRHVPVFTQDGMHGGMTHMGMVAVAQDQQRQGPVFVHVRVQQVPVRVQQGPVLVRVQQGSGYMLVQQGRYVGDKFA